MSRRRLSARMSAPAWVEWTTLAPNVPRLAALTVFILLIVQPGRTGYSWGKPYTNWRTPVDQMNTGPKFEEVPDSVSIPAGKDAYLPCRVSNLGEKVVSWLRKPNLSILTSGVTTFTADRRIVVLHSAGSDSWNLRISSTKLEDSGQYECQVNAEPKISHVVTLYITESHLRDSPYGPEGKYERADVIQASTSPTRAQILGPPVQTVPAGATITLTCEVRGVISGSVFWRHAGRPVSLRTATPSNAVGGVSVDTERNEKRATSRLTVSGVVASDSGEYTCSPESPAAVPASVTLEVLQGGGHSEAMQGDSVSSSTASASFSRKFYRFLSTLTVFLILFHSNLSSNL